MCFKTQNSANDVELEERSRPRRERIMAIEKAKRDILASDALREADGLGSQKLKQAFDDGLESVKKMNQLVAFAKVQTIRDAQIQQRARIRESECMRNTQIEKTMEDKRLKDIEHFEQQEREKGEKQRAGALIIVDQMQEALQRRQEADLMVEKEREHILRQMEETRRFEFESQEDKMRKQRAMFEEVMEFNRISMERKEETKRKALQEDLQLIEYAKQRDLEEKRREDERIAVAAKREEELGQLRAHQEKMADRNEEKDLIRARRAGQAAERAARAKEEEERIRQEEINHTLAEARRIQRAERQLALIEQARIEKDEFDRMIESQMAQGNQAVEREAKEAGRAKIHAEQLREQIRANQEKRLQTRAAAREEGRIVRSQIRRTNERIVAAKTEKVAHLVAAGVPNKYCMNLIKYVPNI